MPYQVLSVPHLPRKKKKIFNTAKKLEGPAKINGAITNDEAKEILLAHSQNQRLSSGGKPAHGLDCFRPLSRPSHIIMGHRKQTARKSYSIASTLPKNVLIATLECEMRAKSTSNTQGPESATPNKPSSEMHAKKTLVDSDVIAQGYLPVPNSARKTLTGLPITYNRLDRDFM